MSTPTVTRTDSIEDIEPDTALEAEPDDEFDLDIRIFESGDGLDQIIRMTDDGCGQTCESACNSC